MEAPVDPPLVFLCLADHVFEGEDTMAVGVQRVVLGQDEPPVNPGSNEPEGEKS